MGQAVIPPPKRIGILGLGLVGLALASRAMASGHVVSGCDRSPAAQCAARAQGIEVLATADNLSASCDAVLVCVLDDAALLSCATALASAASQPGLVLSCVTASVEATVQAATLVQRAGTDFADMPLLGSSRQIADGQALGLLGASEATAERWSRLLHHLCPRYRVAGPAGYGVRAKLACNLILGLNRAALAEGLALATTMGLDGNTFLELLRESPAYSRVVDVAGPRMVARDFTPVSRIRQHRKDLALILDQGRIAGLDLELTAAHANLLDRAIQQGLGELDNVAIIAAILPAVTDNTSIHRETA